jgi:uncharacterized protein YaaQ
MAGKDPPGRSTTSQEDTMKLIFAIVQDEDADNLTDALVSEGFRITRIGSTGSFLRMGNSSIMVGVEESQVPQVISIIRRVCRRRKQMAVPYSPALEPGLLYMPENFEVEVGGAVIFTHNVVRFERL